MPRLLHLQQQKYLRLDFYCQKQMLFYLICLEKFCFSFFSNSYKNNKKYLSMIAGVQQSSIPADRYREIRNTFKEKREKVSISNQNNIILFGLSSFFLLLSPWSYEAMVIGIIFIIVCTVFEFRHFTQFIMECLPSVIILREIFGAKDTHYPY